MEEQLMSGFGCYAVGVDVGATRILAGRLGLQSGKVLRLVQAPGPTDGADPILASIGAAISKVVAQAPTHVVMNLSGIGLGLPGQVARAAGVLRCARSL